MFRLLSRLAGRIARPWAGTALGMSTLSEYFFVQAATTAQIVKNIDAGVCLYWTGPPSNWFVYSPLPVVVPGVKSVGGGPCPSDVRDGEIAWRGCRRVMARDRTRRSTSLCWNS